MRVLGEKLQKGMDLKCVQTGVVPTAFELSDSENSGQRLPTNPLQQAILVSATRLPRSQRCHPKMAGASALLLAMVALRVAAVEPSRLVINKCCDVNEQLNSEGNACVDADRAPFHATRRGVTSYLLVPPFDQAWVNEWLPPGIPLQRVDMIFLKEIPFIQNVKHLYFLNKTAIFNAKQYDNTTYWKHNIVFGGSSIWIRNPSTSKLLQTGSYCVDSIKGSDSRFAVLVNSFCPTSPFGITKCCRRREVLEVLDDGKMSCKSQENSTSFKSPYDFYYLNVTCPGAAELAWEAVTVDQVKKADYCSRPFLRARDTLRSLLCADSVVDGEEVPHALVYCQWPLISQGVFYSCSRFLPFVTVALLAVALVAIACTSRLRSSAHGWALATHATCFLLFNAGQAAFLFTYQHDLKNSNFVIPLDKKEYCLSFAFAMYILMVAATNWLTAVSLNMVSGFSVLQGRRAGAGRERRRFLWLSAVAWGVTAVLAVAAICTFYQTTEQQYYRMTDIDYQKYIGIDFIGSWYHPTFAETRTCFSDIRHSQTGRGFEASKLGSLLFYFGPVGALLLVNTVCLGTTARRVHYLRRGHSLLKRANAEGGRRGSLSQAQSMLVYVKLLLSAGAIETFMEIAAWAFSHTSGNFRRDDFLVINYLDVYRAVGRLCDLLRALCVLWLAAPGGPAKIAALWKRLVAQWKRNNKRQ